MPKTLIETAGPDTRPAHQLAASSPSGPPVQADIFGMPATQAQERFWSLNLLNPGNPGLNMPMMWQCTGPLNVTLLNEAFCLAVERHEVLRTSFDILDGRLNQIIGLPYKVTVPVVDLEHIPDAANSLEALRLTREHAAYRMDLRNGPLLVLKLLRFDETHHMLLVTMHHIICDGVSLGVLLRDVAAFYESLIYHRRAVLPELPIQFADFAIWQEEWRGSQEHQASLEFWRKSLGNQFSKVALPRDIMRAEVLDEVKGEPAAGGDIGTKLIPSALTARAQEFCKRESITLNVLLMSVFSALLSRVTGQSDLLVASPTANRSVETEDLVGLFMNIQVMRVRLEEGTTLQSLLEQVNKWTLGASSNQQLPFEELVHDPFFSVGENSFELPVFFLYQRSFMVTYQIGGLEIVPLRSMSPGAIFEMMFAIVNRDNEGPRLQLEYNPLHFRSSTIERYLNLYLSMLESALEDPLAVVEGLSLARGAEMAEILPMALIAGLDGDSGLESFPAMLSGLAATTPNQAAVECDGEGWSYARLAGFADQLAQRLLREGLEPGGRVALCLERSPALLGAILGVLQAGGVCVLLDTKAPGERLNAILADAGATILLAKSDPAFAVGTKILRLDGSGSADSDTQSATQEVFESTPFVPSPSKPLAFLVYTFDAKGAPTGISIEHAALVKLLVSAGKELNLDASDCLMAASPTDSDLAILEMLLPLTLGARCVIATGEQLTEGSRLKAVVERNGVTMLSGASETLRSLVDAGWSAVDNLRFKLLCDLETLPRDLTVKLLGRVPELWTVFGTAEATICSTVTRMQSVDGPSLIGRPLTGTDFYLLDANQRPLPPGVAGRFYIGGECVAPGYWNRPELTSERFIGNPFGRGTLYRTGEIGRWQETGSSDGTAGTPLFEVELLEPSERQVRIEGRRVELGEVEVALSRHPEVSEAVALREVVPHLTGIAAGPRLIGFVEVPEQGGPIESARIAQELRGSLARALPAYLVPEAIIVLAHLPRRQDGAIDRKALLTDAGNLESISDALIHEREAEEQTSRDPIEWQLVEIWRDTLGMPQISVDDKFLSLGVSSLAALRLITKMNRVYSTNLSLANFFTAHTIREIAELIRGKVSPSVTSSLVKIQAHGKQPPLFILHGVGGNVISFYGLAMHLGKDQPVYGLQSQALLADRPALLRLPDMARYYVEEIRRVQPEGPYRLLGYSFGGTVVMEMAHQLTAAGQEVALLGMLDSKSRQYMRDLAAYRKAISTQNKVNRRMKRMLGNTVKLTWTDRLKYLIEKGKSRGIRLACNVAAALHIGTLPSFMKDAYEINSVASLNYEVRQYDGRMTLFRASKQAMPTAPADLGWGRFFTQGVDVHMLPGDHERIFAEQNIEILAAEINECLQGSSHT